MNPVDHTKTQQLLIDFSRQFNRTDKFILALQHALKLRPLASGEKPKHFGSIVAGYLGFNRELMDRMNYGS